MRRYSAGGINAQAEVAELNQPTTVDDVIDDETYSPTIEDEEEI